MLKLICSIVFVFFISSCKAQSDVGLSQMTSILWQEDIDYLNKKIQKEFASFDSRVKSKFENNSKKLKGDLSSLSNTEVAIKIGQLVAGLGDGHTEMSVLQSGVDPKRLPLVFYFFEEGLFIIGAHEPYQDWIGKQVLQIGDKTVAEIFELLKTIMTYDNEYEILHAGPAFLQLPSVLQFLGLSEDASSIKLKLKQEDTEMLKEISALPLDAYIKGPWLGYWDINNIERPLYATKTDKKYWFKYLEEEKAMYFYFGRTNNQKGQASIKKTVQQMFAEIDKLHPSKLIIDIRHNRGGNYHKSRPLVEAIKKHASLNEKGKLFVISGRTTFSAAMVTSIFLKKETNAIIIGEPSRGHPNKTDNVEYMTLPNSKLRLEYTTKVKKHWPELGDSDHVPVDVTLSPRFQDYSLGMDTVLEYILKQN